MCVLWPIPLPCSSVVPCVRSSVCCTTGGDLEAQSMRLCPTTACMLHALAIHSWVPRSTRVLSFWASFVAMLLLPRRCVAFRSTAPEAIRGLPGLSLLIPCLFFAMRSPRCCSKARTKRTPQLCFTKACTAFQASVLICMPLDASSCSSSCLCYSFDGPLRLVLCSRLPVAASAMFACDGSGEGGVVGLSLVFAVPVEVCEALVSIVSASAMPRTSPNSSQLIHHSW